MSYYFIVDVYIDESKGRGSYDDYIEKVKPIVESFGGEYLVRSEKVTALSVTIIKKSQYLCNPGNYEIFLKSILFTDYTTLHLFVFCLYYRITLF